MSASGLTPGSVVQAAAADLQRHVRNLEVRERQAWRGGRFEPYAFHRDHVRRANAAHELIALALKQPGFGVGSGKRTTRNLYADAPLLSAALEQARAV